MTFSLDFCLCAGR